ncbi:MAG: hypothetical protein H0U54_04460 [Acidobacteria bacterium]|jgi:hypothetical protein|nr:hypothetical protein [Acidobacteriota bacterium]
MSRVIATTTTVFALSRFRALSIVRVVVRDDNERAGESPERAPVMPAMASENKARPGSIVDFAVEPLPGLNLSQVKFDANVALCSFDSRECVDMI